MNARGSPSHGSKWLAVALICLSQIAIVLPARAAPRLAPLGDATDVFVRVTNDTSSDRNPTIVRTSDGEIWAVWDSDRSGNWDLWYKTSLNNGASWSAPIRLTDHTESDLCPAIMETSGGNIWVTWYSNRTGNWDVFYKHTSDSSIWITWCSYRQDSNWEIWAKSTSNLGTSWSAPIRITTDAAWDYDPALMVAGDGTFWIVWYSERSGNRDLWYKTSANGVNWSGATRVTSDSGSDQNPSTVQTGDNTIWLAWHSDRSGNWDLWYKSTSTGGATWSGETRHSLFTGNDEAPGLCSLTGTQPAFVWHADRYGQDDIFFGMRDTHADLNPPPHVDEHEYFPSPIPIVAGNRLPKSVIRTRTRPEVDTFRRDGYTTLWLVLTPRSNRRP